MFEAQLVQYGGPILDALGRRGFDLEIVDDYSRVETMIAEVGRLETTPMMDVSRLDFERGEAFWVFLKRDGACVASVSAKVVDLRSESLASYIRRTSTGQYRRTECPIKWMDPFFEYIRGIVVYTGQIQTEEKSPDRTNLQVSDLIKFLRFTQLVILSRWDFNWMYGFVAEDHLAMNRHYRFSTAVQQAIEWHEPVPHGRQNSHVLLASPRRQVELLFPSKTDKLGENQSLLSV